MRKPSVFAALALALALCAAGAAFQEVSAMTLRVPHVPLSCLRAVLAAGDEGAQADKPAAPEAVAPKQEDFHPDLPAAAVKRTNDDFPLSDQDDHGHWVRYEPMCDEFSGTKLDATKWWDHNPGWLGRQPSFFSPSNVAVSGGQLHLTMRLQQPPEDMVAKGYHKYTSAAVQSKGTVLYGYFEIRARPMRSGGSSAFWFYHGTPKEWTEIDVFEMGAGMPGYERKDFITLHVQRLPNGIHGLSYGSVYEPPFDLADAYHVYGLEWDAKKLRFYFDGVLVREVQNLYWHQALTLNFDSETMPEWWGLPRDEDLPSTFSIDYVRAWKHK